MNFEPTPAPVSGLLCYAAGCDASSHPVT